MHSIVSLDLLQFGITYLLLIVVLFVMKKAKINQTKLLVVASIRMTVQLILAGLILTYIFANPHPVFTILYILIMVGFSAYRILSKNRWLNRQFKIYIVLAISLSGILILVFFLKAVVGISMFNPQYAIPIGGMIIGNAMTGITLGLKSFHENLDSNRTQIGALLDIGASPKKILLPFVNSAIESALLPTLNSMLGLGIVSLPGMMTGQILSGTLPLTAIMYQIAIMIAICTSVCLAVFLTLYLGYQTLYNRKNQFML
jgi:TIGR00245 family protein